MAYYDPENPQDNPNDNPGQPAPNNQTPAASTPSPAPSAPTVVNPNAGANESPYLPSNPGAPAFGQPSLSEADIRQALSAAGIVATPQEVASQLENANKYGASGILNNIAARTDNNPGSGNPGTATAASLGLTAGAGNRGIVPVTRPTTGGNRGSGAPTFGTYATPNVPNQPNTSPQFTDPGQQLVESTALSRLQQLQNPDPNSGTAIYEQYAKQLMATLQQAPYTSGDEATIKAGAFNSIEADRTATKQRWLEELSRRGILPSSGVALDGLNKIENQFNQLRATVDNSFAQNAITTARNNRLQALDVAGSLAGSENNRLDAALNVSRIPYNLSTDAFNQNIAAVQAGGSPQANVQSALSLMTATQNSQTLSSANKAQALQALFDYIGGLAA